MRFKNVQIHDFRFQIRVLFVTVHRNPAKPETRNLAEARFSISIALSRNTTVRSLRDKYSGKRMSEKVTFFSLRLSSKT